jgi:hypothetical protein
MTDEYNKKVVYMENDRVHADLKLKIHYDGITQADFFRGCVRAYLEEEGAFMTFLDKLKEQRTKQATRVRSVANKATQAAAEQRHIFGLDNTDIEDIFDILEKEHEDL